MKGKRQRYDGIALAPRPGGRVPADDHVAFADYAAFTAL
jgi:hypothetical protein